MSNPNDVIRDSILRHLQSTHSKARSPKTAGVGIRELAHALKPKGYKLQEVASNLDYLVQKGWVRETIDRRTFTTPRGTTQVSEKRTYKISDKGIDRLESASTYQRTEAHPHINVTNIRGVTIVGDGNVVNTTFTDLARTLSELQKAITAESALGDNEKLNLVADIDSLQSQLQKPEPEKSIIRSLWSGIERAAAVGGLIELAHRARELIQPLLK
jgi:hypothetical protein